MRLQTALIFALCLTLGACGGGSSAPATGGAGSGGGTPSGGGSPGGAPGGGGTPPGSATSPAAVFADRIGKPRRLLVGLGAGNTLSSIQSQALQIDVFDHYLPHFVSESWIFNFGFGPTDGTYVDRVVDRADQAGAVPMFTLYQFAYRGEDDPALLSDRAAMQQIWDNIVVLFDRLAVYDKPVMVNIEPDFWGYAYRFSPGNDPDRQFAHVKIAADCASLPDTVTGIAQCMLRTAGLRAPKALIGFPPSDFGFGTQNTIDFMNAIGADDADFIVAQTLDRDAGCFEVRGQNCSRPVTAPYWDSADFDAHFAEMRAYHEGIGGLPLVWWQTPMGVPSATPGGSPGAWRDNRVDTFLRNPQRLVDAGGVAVVFSAGADGQTTIDSDGGHFQARLNNYLAAPAALP